MCIKSWVDCGIVSIGQLFGADGYLTYAFRRRFPNAKADFLLYEEFYLLLEAVKDNQVLMEKRTLLW